MKKENIKSRDFHVKWPTAKAIVRANLISAGSDCSTSGCRLIGDIIPDVVKGKREGKKKMETEW